MIDRFGWKDFPTGNLELYGLKKYALLESARPASVRRLADRVRSAESNYRAGRFKAALRDFEAVTTKFSDCAWARAMAGACRLALGETRAALRAWARAFQQEPACLEIYRLDPRKDSVEKRLLRGHIQFEKLDYAAALRSFEGAARFDAASGPAFALLARHLHFVGRPADSARAIRRAGKLSPRCGWIAAWNALALERAGDAKAALAQFDRAQRLAPAYVGTYAWRGACRKRLGMPAEALEDLTAAIELAGPLETGQASSYFERNNALAELGRYEEALEDLNQAVRLNAKYAWRGPLEQLDRAIEARPCNAWAWAWRGHCKLESGRPVDAIHDFDRALTLDPKCAWAYAWRGLAHFRLSRARRALRDLERAARLDPKFPWTFVWRGTLLHRLGRSAQAATDFKRAIRLDPACAWAHYWAAANCAAIGKPREALERLEDALDLDPRFEQAKALSSMVKERYALS